MKQKAHRKKKSAGRKNSRSAVKLLYLATAGVIVGTLIFIFGFGGPGSNPAPDVIPGGSLAVTDDFYNLGRVSMKDGRVSRRYQLQNIGDEAALIRKLYTS